MNLEVERFPDGTVIWPGSNVYPTASLGSNVSIGGGCEIGDGVNIVGPKCCFTNDNFPPSPKEQWESIVVEEFARIGAGCIILPGVVVGAGSLLGAGSVLTKSLPAGETWAGNPARKMVKK